MKVILGLFLIIFDIFSKVPKKLFDIVYKLFSVLFFWVDKPKKSELIWFLFFFLPLFSIVFYFIISYGIKNRHKSESQKIENVLMSETPNVYSKKVLREAELTKKSVFFTTKNVFINVILTFTTVDGSKFEFSSTEGNHKKLKELNYKGKYVLKIVDKKLIEIYGELK